jgi:hypothetical protein
LFVCSRWPFTNGRPAPVFLGWVKLSGSVVMTPGRRRESWEKLRPLSGMFWIVVPEMTSPTTASWVWRMGATPVTSTLSATPPTCIVMSMRAFWPDSSRMRLVS